jgi:hypothetical protein
VTLTTVILERTASHWMWLGSGEVHYYVAQTIPRHREPSVALEVQHVVSVLRQLPDGGGGESVHTAAVSVGRGVGAVLVGSQPVAINESDWVLVLWSGVGSIEVQAIDSDREMLDRLVVNPKL